jgi:hypothetical protein
MRPFLAGILLLLVLGACTGSDQPGRFTYIVHYTVTATDTPAVTYVDALGATVAFTGPFPQTVEFPMDYDYANTFVPQMDGTSGGLPFTMTIGWRDYATGFSLEVLAQQTVDSGSYTLTGPVLPP